MKALKHNELSPDFFLLLFSVARLHLAALDNPVLFSRTAWNTKVPRPANIRVLLDTMLRSWFSVDD